MTTRPVRPLRSTVLTASVALAAAAAAAPALAGGSPNGEVYDLRVVALTGQDAPGLFAGAFTALDLPSLNASGQVAFAAYTDGTFVNAGIWATRADDPSSFQIAMGDDLFPPDGPAGVRYAAFGSLSHVHPYVADDGTIDFWAPLDGYSTGEPLRGGYFRFDGAATQSVAQPDQSVNGIPDATIAHAVNSFASSDANLIGFKVSLEGPGIDASNDDALLVEWIGGLTPIVREGSAAPGLPGQTWAPIWGFGNPQIGPDGLMTFPVTLDDGIGLADGLYQGFPGLFEPILVEGDELPGAGPFTGFGTYARFAANAAGAVVVAAGFDDGGYQRGIFRLENGVRTTVARTNGPGPLGTYDGSVPSSRFAEQPQIADDGTIVFTARFVEPAADADTAILRQRPGQPAQVVLREGDPAYGYWGGVVFEDFEASIGWPAMDRTGRIYVNSSVRGPGIDPTNDRGLWSIDPDGSINLVVRGQMGIQVGPWDVRYVDDVSLWSGQSASAGERPSVNDRGDVAFRVRFTDDSEAVIHAVLPPACPADRDGDGFVTFADLLIVLAAFDQTGPVGTGGDADWDGDTDFDDLLIVLSAFGDACNPV